MEATIHVLRVTAAAGENTDFDTGSRHSFVVFVRCVDAESAYAPAEAQLRQSGFTDIDLVDCRSAPPDAVERLGESLQTAYQEAATHGAAAVYLKPVDSSD